MANIDPPAISTPSRPRYSLNPKRSGTFTSSGGAGANSPNVAGFSPGGQVFEGYSYLSRSTSMSTSTRSRPKGLQSRTSDMTTTPPTAPRNLPSSPSSPHIPRAVAASPASSPFTNPSDLPQRRRTISHGLPSSFSVPELHHSTSTANTHPPRSESESERLAEAVAALPHNPKSWLPSQVALYLTHVLGLVPRPVVEDVTAYVRSSRMGGRAFLRLSEKDLERQGLNLKWRKLMIEAVRKLRRDALRGRIWGYESGSLRWPKSAQDLEREEADEEDLGQEDELNDGIVRSNSKTTSKLTLKRMRDSRKVRGMIQAFQTSPDKNNIPLSTVPIDAIYGQGYVKEQAQHILSEAEQKKLSLRRPLRPRRSTADFPWLESSAEPNKEDIEALLASLSEQEANDLAAELGIADLQDTDAVGRALASDTKDRTRDASAGESADEVMQMPTLTRHGSVDSTSMEEGESSVSECSGTESEVDYADDLEESEHKPRYGVLDEELIRAIMADEELPVQHAQDSPKSQLTRSHTTASILRPGRPYRASLYTDDELAALNENGFHTRTESSRELVELSCSTSQEDLSVAEPDFGTARLRSAEEKAQDIAPPIPSFETSPTAPVETAQQEDEYIFNPPPSSASASRTNSIRRTVGRKATFGSKRGKAVLSLLHNPDSELFASLPGATMLRQQFSAPSAAAATSADEEGWGGTLGRSSSRKSLNSVFDAPVGFGRKRGLDRVASEAEAEAVCARMDEMEKEKEQEVETPLARYEETVLSKVEGEDEDGLGRRASVESRLSKLFNEGVEVGAPAAEEVVDAVVTDETAVEEVEAEAVEERSTEEVEAPSAVEAGEATVSVEAPPKKDESERVAEPTAEPELAIVSDVSIEDEAAATSESTEETLSASEDSTVANPNVIAVPEPATPTELVELAIDNAAPTESVPNDQLEIPTPPAAPSDESASAEVSHSPTASDLDTYEIIPSHTTTEPLPVPLSQPAATTAAATAEDDSTTSSKLLVPLTVLEPHPSGTGSIKKRSMVLVDRKRFESLARRMGDLEAQLEAADARVHCKSGSSVGSVGSGAGLRGMFGGLDGDIQEGKEGQEVVSEGDVILEEILAATATTSTTAAVVEPTCDKTSESGSVEQLTLEDSPPGLVQQPKSGGGGWRSYLNPTSWASYLSSLNPYYGQAATCSSTSSSRVEGGEIEEEMSLYALLGRPESEQEKHLLSIGAIPAYMLGLGAGVGFVLVREVLGKSLTRH
ncbi:uncharacterized protein UTRI_04068_B [Ustilago trichophora]|uniref:SAM domain-containing protein n=1 Tax=Ustilago trichophora TaxID=86804 RepID=A0A5C3EC87_9BASI|nr:uncharacterized protein UTRI_04068_B [Ustilago trichophora]